MPLPGKGLPTFYNMVKLHKVLFALSVLWFILLVLLVWQDYNREWRFYQREFRKLDIQQSKIALEKEVNPGFRQQLEEKKQQMRKAQAEIESHENQIRELNSRIKSIDAELYLVDQQWRFAKSRRDALRYAYEKARQSGDPDVESREKALHSIEVNVDALFESLKTLQQEKTDTTAKLEEIQKNLLDLEKDLQTATLSVSNLEKKVASLQPSWVNRLRDIPLLDFMVPYFKINQIYLPDAYYNFTFRYVERADRCVTCHLGIDNPAFADAPQPYRTHPRLDLMVGSSSPHPMNKYGCTLCHMGRDRGTSFNSAAHSPQNAEQAEAWAKKYDWKPLTLWEEPMLPLPYTESSCLICHKSEVQVREAPTLNRGLTLVRRIGCYGCHRIAGMEFLPKAGPSLEKIAAKTNKTWTFHWIKDPRMFRPSWMPKFFDLSNTSDSESLKRNNLEALAITTYLFAKSSQEVYPSIPVQGNPETGKQLVESLGCLGCHTLTPKDWVETPSESNRKFGPNLSSLASKVSPEWLFYWLKNPRQYLPKARMPNLRLTDQEAADITAYLLQDKNTRMEVLSLPKIDAALLNELISEQWKQKLTQQEINARLSEMSEKDKLLFLGQNAISRYGCFGCHDIPGFEDAQPIGTELTEEGDKPLHQLDFGYLHIEHNRWSWFLTKLSDPRIFDRGRSVRPLDKLRMPHPLLKEKDIQSLVTVLLGLRNNDIVGETLRRPETSRTLALDKGWQVITTHNCIGCHKITFFGGDIRAVFEQLHMTPGTEPPILKYENLPGIGARTRSDWLYHFLKQPKLIRPWLNVRMPTFDLTDQELNQLSQFFSALDNVPYPFEESWFSEPPSQYVEEGRAVFNTLRCLQCHVTGPVDIQSVDASSLAPNIALVRERLRPDWITLWLKDPSKILPGTKMPTYPWQYLGNAPGIPQNITNPDDMITAVRNYLLNYQLIEKPPSR